MNCSFWPTCSPPPARQGAAPASPPFATPLPPAGPRLTFLLRRTDGTSLAALIQQVREAVLQAALSSGATSPPVVSVTKAPDAGRRRLAAAGGASPEAPDAGRRRLAAAGGASPEALLVTVAFSPQDSAPAQVLGSTLLSQPQTVLPPEQFGILEVQSVALDGQLITPAPPPAGRGSGKTAFIAGAVGGSAAIVVAGVHGDLCCLAWPWRCCAAAVPGAMHSKLHCTWFAKPFGNRNVPLSS